MRSFWAMLIANIKMSVRNRQAMFWNLMFPALFIILFGSIWDNDNFSNFEVGIIGADTPLSAAVIGAMESADGISVHQDGDEAEMEALENNDRALLLEFPGAESDPIRIYSADNPGDVTSSIAMSVTRSILTDVIGAEIGLDIEEVKVESLNTTFMDWFLPGIIAMSLMNTGIIGISTGFVTLRERGILRRIKVTPLPLWKFLTARVLAALVVGLISTIILIALAVVLFDATVRGNWLLVLLAIVIVSASMLSIGAAIAAIARNVETAAGLANMITFPMMFLSGVFFPINTMPDWMRPIMAIMPLRYGVEALREPMLYGNGIGSIWLQLLILIVLSVVALGIAVRFFTWDSVKK